MKPMWRDGNVYGQVGELSGACYDAVCVYRRTEERDHAFVHHRSETVFVEPVERYDAQDSKRAYSDEYMDGASTVTWNTAPSYNTGTWNGIPAPTSHTISGDTGWWAFPYMKDVVAAMLRNYISFLRKTGKGRYYTVNKVYDGGYAYIFFERPRDSQSADKRYMTDDETDIVMTGCIYAEDLLYKSDFNGIQIGDTMEDVLEVDHAMVLPMQFCSWNEDIYGFKKENYITKHLLRDGVLVISYAVNASKDDYTITAIEYFSDSIFIANDYFDPMDQGYPKNYSILPQDYPPET